MTRAVEPDLTLGEQPTQRLRVPSGRPRHVVWIRHGETQWNREFRLQSRAPVPLNDAGRAQLAWTSESLLTALRQDTSPRRVRLWSSPVLRAVQSAELIRDALTAAGHPPHAPLQIHDGITEFDMGRFTGHTMDELVDDPDWKAYVERPGCAVFPGGESMTQIAARTAEAFLDIMAADEAEVVVIVSHGGVIRTLIMQLLGVPCEHFHLLRISNASLTVARCRPPDHLRFLLINSTPGSLPLL